MISLPPGATLDETRTVRGCRVNVWLTNALDEPLSIDEAFWAGLFVEAALDGQAEYQWEFDVPIHATVTR